MTITPQLIKSILKMAGIHDLSIDFDIPCKQIIARFDLAGQPQTKLIPFADIELAFSSKQESAGKAG